MLEDELKRRWNLKERCKKRYSVIQNHLSAIATIETLENRQDTLTLLFFRLLLGRLLFPQQFSVPSMYKIKLSHKQHHVLRR